jgi:hypothetical protein
MTPIHAPYPDTQNKGRPTRTRPDIGTYARRVLKKMANGTPLSRQATGWQVGRLAVPATVVDAIQRADLIEARDNGFVLSGPGRRLLERLDASEDPFASQNRLLAQRNCKVEGTRQKVTMNLADNPLAWLARRKLLTPAQLEAGDRLRADYALSHAAPRVTMNWQAPPLGNTRRGAPEGLDPTLAQIAARRRFDGAVTAVGSGLGDVLVRVVCEGEGLETAEKALAWPARAAKLVLGFALDRLVMHYGISR